MYFVCHFSINTVSPFSRTVTLSCSHTLSRCHFVMMVVSLRTFSTVTTFVVVQLVRAVATNSTIVTMNPIIDHQHPL
jgi:hypothetical protein